mmetsp:Transcript_13417/g.40669  ORF Transcript_13417/g.40669 Transcript_13417/m.40669 type:complete len:244 (+) Transcript_13417:1780-2511(+)
MSAPPSSPTTSTSIASFLSAGSAPGRAVPAVLSPPKSSRHACSMLSSCGVTRAPSWRTYAAHTGSVRGAPTATSSPASAPPSVASASSSSPSASSPLVVSANSAMARESAVRRRARYFWSSASSSPPSLSSNPVYIPISSAASASSSSREANVLESWPMIVSHSARIGSKAATEPRRTIRRAARIWQRTATVYSPALTQRCSRAGSSSRNCSLFRSRLTALRRSSSARRAENEAETDSDARET